MSSNLSIPIQEYRQNIISRLESDQHDGYSKCLARDALFAVQFHVMNDKAFGWFGPVTIHTKIVGK